MRAECEASDAPNPQTCGFWWRVDGAHTSPAHFMSGKELEAAHAAASPEYLGTLRRIVENIRKFQESVLNLDVSLLTRVEGGKIELQQRYLPLKRVGICVPGGAAAYPSTLLRTAVPAQVAGVKEIAVIAPPTAFGSYNNDLLAAFKAAL